jgi:DegV family protein with EDD domain
MTVRIVTDSTSDIPLETAAEYGIIVVPVYVHIDEVSYLDGVELSRSEFYRKLPEYPSPPTTAAPSPGAFTETYNRLAEEGVTHIISVHVASSLSGLLNAARLGSEATDAVQVTLFDSQQLTMGLGLQAMIAAEAAADGCSVPEIVDLLTERVKRTYVLGLLDTMEYLRRSGRVNWAEFGIGTLLKIKPIMQVHMGNVQMLEKIRTSKRALDRFLELAADFGPLEKLALLYINATQKEIETFRRQTHFLVPDGTTPLAVELTPALGAHIGPGGLGIACVTVNDR